MFLLNLKLHNYVILFYFYVLYVFILFLCSFLFSFYVLLRSLFFLLDVDTKILHEMQMQTVVLKKLTNAVVDIAAYIKQL